MCPTSAMAKSTMRRDKPPVFMISPASMKKGTANKGKLLAPSIRFCARIWASNMSICHMRATPHSNKENAIGMPSAMAASNDPKKTAMVTVVLSSYFKGASTSTGSSSDSRTPINSCSDKLPDTNRQSLFSKMTAIETAATMPQA